ncbi:hypothetical protein MLD38_015040 [Melastoma candidum]|uniref:Uncharacterized protein n=1 Tax=Melastoma candidum TaxID=119954 RepID=A0ACB9REG7_9MYRT|nr:hypothetical protein MLD38_015040 [Melastoma candidum]
MASFEDGNRVALSDREDEGSSAEEESCSAELGSEDSNPDSPFSSEITDDTGSSCSPSSFSGGLFEFSDLMANLPVKRGLSKYYDGKSQSFSCLGRATNLEDLIKKDHGPCSKRIKLRKSHVANVGPADHRHRLGRSYSPKATISKKMFRNSLFTSTTGARAASSSSGSTIGAILNLGSIAKD